jgi:DNA-binding SARP family transcriptional activator
MPFALHLLGGFSLSDAAGRAVTITLQKSRAVLAILALSPRGRTTRQELIGLLWSERDPVQAHQSLRQTLLSLRRDLAAADIGGLGMNRVEVWLDLSLFEADVIKLGGLLGAARILQPEELLALPTGRFLEGMMLHDPAGDAWIADWSGKLKEGVVKLTLAGLQASRRAERSAEVAALAQRLLKLDLACEEAHRALIAHHLAQGERSLAVRQYQHCRKALTKAFSTAPARATQELMQAVVSTSIQAPSPPQSATPLRSAMQRTFHGPSLLIEPFDVRDDGRRTRLLAQGLVDDLVVDLSRLSLLGVLPPRSSLRQVRGGAPDDARELGVDYVLGGVVESRENATAASARISVLLRDAASGRAIWAERYERDFDDLWSLRQDVVGRIANTACRAVDMAELDRLEGVDTRNRDAWELRVLGQKSLLLYNRTANARARSLFHRALSLDPSFAQAETGIGWTHLEDFCFGWSDRPEGSLAAAEHHSRRVLQRNRHYYAALHLLSYVELCRREFERSAETCARARDDNPNDADLQLHHGYVMGCGGAPEPAIDLMLQAAAINPMHPNWYRLLIGNTALDAQRPHAALRELTRFIDEQPGPVVGVKAQAIRTRAAAHAMAGDFDSARADRDVYMAANRQFSVATFRRTYPRKDANVVSRQAAALAEAGFPD